MGFSNVLYGYKLESLVNNTEMLQEKGEKLFKGTVQARSGTRINRITQGPLMSSCKHL